MKSFAVLVLASLVASCAGVFPGFHNGRFGGIFSRRDAPSVDKVLKTIETTLQKAHKSIKGKELCKAMNKIIADVDQLTAGQEVDDEAVQDFIKEVFQAIDNSSSVPIPFEDPFWRQEGALSITSSLLRELAEETKELKKSGESVVPALEAISKTAEIICGIVNEIVSIAKYNLEQGKEYTKRSQERRFIGVNIGVRVRFG